MKTITGGANGLAAAAALVVVLGAAPATAAGIPTGT